MLALWLSLAVPRHPPLCFFSQALNALNSLLKGQVELFRLVQADPRLENIPNSYRYTKYRKW